MFHPLLSRTFVFHHVCSPLSFIPSVPPLSSHRFFSLFPSVLVFLSSPCFCNQSCDWAVFKIFPGACQRGTVSLKQLSLYSLVFHSALYRGRSTKQLAYLNFSNQSLHGALSEILFWGPLFGFLELSVRQLDHSHTCYKLIPSDGAVCIIPHECII